MKLALFHYERVPCALPVIPAKVSKGVHCVRSQNEVRF